MNRFVTAFSMLMLVSTAGIGASAAETKPAAPNCGYCNTLRDTGACCRATVGCSYVRNPATEAYVCQSNKNPEAALPKAQCTKPEVCMKSYRACVSRAIASKSSLKQHSREVQAANLRSERQKCQARLNACRKSCP